MYFRLVLKYIVHLFPVVKTMDGESENDLGCILNGKVLKVCDVLPSFYNQSAIFIENFCLFVIFGNTSVHR